MTGWQRGLLGLLVLQLALWTGLRLWGGGGAGDRKPFFPGLDAGEVTQLVVAGAEGDSLVVVRQAGGWGLAAFGGYPADSAKVEGLLQQLTEVRVGNPVVSGEGYHAALGVSPESYERRLSLYTEDQTAPAFQVWIGRSPSSGVVYARQASAGAVYEVEGLPSYEVTPSAAAWIVGRLFEFQPERVQAFSLRNPAGAFAAARSPEGWTLTEPAALAGRTLAPSRVDSFLRANSAIYAVEPMTLDASGAGEPAALLRLELAPADGSGAPTVRELWVWPSLGGEMPHRPVGADGSSHLAAVHENSLFRVLNEVWSDLRP